MDDNQTTEELLQKLTDAAFRRGMFAQNAQTGCNAVVAAAQRITKRAKKRAPTDTEIADLRYLCSEYKVAVEGREAAWNEVMYATDALKAAWNEVMDATDALKAALGLSE